MALGKISGAMLTSNLERDGADLAFETDLLYLDVANGRIGIKTNVPDQDLQVNGNARLGNWIFDGDSLTPGGANPLSLGNVGSISIGGGQSGYVLSTDGSGGLTWTSVSSLLVSTGSTGMQVTLGQTDAPLDENVAWDQFTEDTKVSNAINQLNQTALNIAQGTFVGATEFTANVLAGPSPMTVAFTASYVGEATDYYWDFGDGSTSTDRDPTHTYSDVGGGQFTVSFKAYNTNGTLAGDSLNGAVGSWDDIEKENYITLYTPNPIPAFTLVSGSINTGTAGTITNNSQYASSYDLDWGDSNSEVPDASWSTLTHTYTNVGGDQVYYIQLDATSATAGPSPVTVEGTPTEIKVYSTHTPAFTTTATTVINEEADNGGVVTFTNTTATDPGATATFTSNRYQWYWGDDSTDSINIQSGLAGNPGSTINHTFALTSAEQTAGTVKTYDVYLSVVNGHTTSPFVTASPVTITVEPDVRSNFSGTATTISDRTGDTAQTGYIFTDYRDGADRSEFSFTTTSQHADTYTWNWGDGQLDSNIAEGAAGTVAGGAIIHSYTSTGNKTVALSVVGQPATLTQTDTETKSNYINIRTNPTAPGDLSTKTISMSTASQGTSPKLAAGAVDNTSGSIPAAGTLVTRYASGTSIESSIVNDANTSISGTLVAKVNDVTDGSVTFDTSSNKSATYSSLVVTDDRDAHFAISGSTYPSGFYKVFSAKVSHPFSALSAGYNNYQLSHSTAGDTNAVGFVKDTLTVEPTLTVANVTMSQASAGSLKYISGVPYYNTGASITISGLEVSDLIGQTYRDTTSPMMISEGTSYESTTGSPINIQTYTYSQIDGAVSFLTGGIPQANTGVGSNYELGNITVSINGSARVVSTLQAEIQNVNGVSSPVELPTKLNVYSLPNSGFDESSIPVLSSLGSGYGDNGKRVALGLSGDNPAYTPSNFYVNDAWSGLETVAGTDEAIVRWGSLEHIDDLDFSTGYLPVGPDLTTGRSGAQYFTFAFRRTLLQNFDIRLTGKVSGIWIAAPGTGIDASASDTNGWIDCNASYAGAGLPGTNTGSGGNGNNGCASTSGDRIPLGTVINDTSYSMTLGSENLSNATGNNCLVRIRLESGDYVSAISIGAVS